MLKHATLRFDSKKIIFAAVVQDNPVEVMLLQMILMVM
jgi:hypothetical protein